MKEVKKLFKVDKFATAIKNLYERRELSTSDIEYLLGCAILLLERFDETKTREYFELAYNIVLRYSIVTKDYTPLYDVSCNYGFYPTVRFINEKSLLEDTKIENALIDFKLEHYKTEDYIETFEQYKSKKAIITSADENISFIAPTSSGKSSLIVKHLMANDRYNKTLVLVPTKSLISQTYNELRGKFTDRKIICHDAMFKGEDRFVGVMTQERALRFLDKNEKVSLDNIYVDEAHNIFCNDPRNVLLSRVIKICKQRNDNLQTIYLSPFISDSNNLLQGNAASINEQRIEYSVKESNIFELDKEGNQYIYDRFSERFYCLGEYLELYGYLKEFSGRKNFIFLNSPQKIESLADELFNNSSEINDKSCVSELKKVLAQNVHHSFKMIKYIDHGIIYLHAKIPDQIKEYLEDQFKTNPAIKYLVANSVILEGVNLPIDRLFIFDAWNMSSSRLLNLIGRVNRLNNVYDLKNADLTKLIPDIHFVCSSYYRYQMRSKILKMYNTEDDLVINPLLNNFSTEKLEKKRKERVDRQNKEIVEQEALYFAQPKSEHEKMKRLLIADGMNQIIRISDESVNVIIKNIAVVDRNQSVLRLVRTILIDNIDGADLIDDAFARLKHDSALNYYSHLLGELRQGNIARIISSQVEYYKKAQEKNPYMFIGEQYGEINPYRDENIRHKKLYIDLRTKNTEELINLLIVKIKIEQDFLSFQYNRAVSFLHDSGVISDDQYNLELYGTNDEKMISMLNYGISAGMLSLLKKNNQLDNVYLDEFGNLTGNINLRRFRDKQDSFSQYELDKYVYYLK